MMRAIRKAIDDAHYNRRYATNGDTPPTEEEIADLIAAVDRLNEAGPTSAFIDAQGYLIEALLVEYERLRNAE